MFQRGGGSFNIAKLVIALVKFKYKDNTGNAVLDCSSKIQIQ